MIESVFDKALEKNVILPSLRSCIYEVLEDGSIKIEVSEEPAILKGTTLRVVN